MCPGLLIHDLHTIPSISWEHRHFYDLDHFNVWRSVSLKMSIYGQKDPIWISTCWEGFIFLLLNGVKMGYRSTLKELGPSFPQFPRKTKARNTNAQFFFLSYIYKNNIAYFKFFLDNGVNKEEMKTYCIWFYLLWTNASHLMV